MNRCEFLIVRRLEFFGREKESSCAGYGDEETCVLRMIATCFDMQQSKENRESGFRLNWALFGGGEKKQDDTPDYISAKVVTDKLTGHTKGYGFGSKFRDESEKIRATTKMNGRLCSTKSMRIGPSANKKSVVTQPYARKLIVSIKLCKQEAFDIRGSSHDFSRNGYPVEGGLPRWFVCEVGVPLADIKELADTYGCLANNLPLTYLGVKVGANMNRIDSWKDVVQKVKNKLSSWKAKTLSVGGRFTLIKSVLGAVPTYYMALFKTPEGDLSYLERLCHSFFLGADIDDRKISWISWNQVMAHKKNGDLGVNSLYALNHALLFKWLWRFLSSRSGLWYNVIQAIHAGKLRRYFVQNILHCPEICAALSDKNPSRSGIEIIKFSEAIAFTSQCFCLVLRIVWSLES
ncbi:RNA-directed DNA polymerase, eukaryota [Tanacetum coccineum]